MAHRILVVDDHAPTCELVRNALESAGLEVAVADNGAACLLAIHEARPDLIILDVSMPVMDGFQTLDVLQQSEQNRDIPVVMLTARSSDREVARGWRTGAIAYVTKPFSVTQLVNVVQRVLGGAPGEGDNGKKA